jgi:predicted amidohydrolase
MRITLAQLDPVLGDIDANVDKATEAIDRAKGDGSDLIVFPELFLSGYSVGAVEQDVSITVDDPRVVELARRAAPMGLHIGLAEDAKRSPHTYNSAVYYEGDRLVHVHRKLHLPTYSIFEERKHFAPGQSLRAFSVGADTTMATLICSDAWQPPLAFIATQDGARALIVPAAGSQSRFPEHYDAAEYWHDITLFYGRIYQLYVIFVNRVGTEGELKFFGDSHVVDPWGHQVAEAATFAEELLTVDIDLREVRNRRRRMPLIKDARLGLIQREISRLVDEGGDLLARGEAVRTSAPIAAALLEDQGPSEAIRELLPPEAVPLGDGLGVFGGAPGANGLDRLGGQQSAGQHRIDRRVLPLGALGGGGFKLGEYLVRGVVGHRPSRCRPAPTIPGRRRDHPHANVYSRTASRVAWSMARLASSSVATSAPPIRWVGTPAAVRSAWRSRRGSWPAQMTTVSTSRTRGLSSTVMCRPASSMES